MAEVTTNGWIEYKQRIFFQLDQLTKQVETLDKKIDILREDVVILKTKAWAFGVIGGGAVAIVFQLAVNFLK